jgi:hypothetical protein
MGIKSRGNWATGACLKRCANRDRKCDECIAFSEYEPLKKDKETDDKILN